MLRIARRGLLALPALMIPGLARADAWPGRTRLVVGFAPGGANDIMARLLVAEYNALIPGGSFVVENRPGAGTLLAAQNILGAPPDGNHLLYASTSTLITALVNQKAGIDVPRDYAAISLAQISPLLLVARADSPANTLAEVIALAKRKQGQLTISHPGNGGVNHLSLALLMQQAGIETATMSINIRARDKALREAQYAAQGGRIDEALRHLGKNVVEVGEGAAIEAAAAWLSLSPSDRARTAIYVCSISGSRTRAARATSRSR